MVWLKTLLLLILFPLQNVIALLGIRSLRSLPTRLIPSRNLFSLSAYPVSQAVSDFVNAIPQQSISMTEFNDRLKGFSYILQSIGISSEVISVVEQKTVDSSNNEAAFAQDSVSKTDFLSLLTTAFNDAMSCNISSNLPPSNQDSRRNTIMVIGDKSSGKSSIVVQLANYWTSREPTKKVLIVAPDHSPSHELHSLLAEYYQHTQSSSIDLFAPPSDADSPERILNAANRHFLGGNYGTMILDAAPIGHDSAEDGSNHSLLALKEAGQVDETLLALDVSAGSFASEIVSSINDSIGITGYVLSNVDNASGDQVLISMLSAPILSGKPIKYISTGKSLDQLQAFSPSYAAKQLLGIKVEDRLSEADEQELQQLKQYGRLRGELRKNLRKGVDFTYNDYLRQVQDLKEYGGMEKVIEMFREVGENSPPWFTRKRITEAEQKLQKAVHIIESMLPAERQFPDLISQDGGLGTCLRRRINIARRAGLPLKEIEEFVRNFRDIRCQMARFVRKYETPIVQSTNSRQFKQSEKLAAAREPAKGFGPPILNSVEDKANGVNKYRRGGNRGRPRKSKVIKPKSSDNE